jgi:hypothetical protein
MFRRPILLAVIAVASMLSACGSGDGAGDPTAATTTGADAAGADAAGADASAVTTDPPTGLGGAVQVAVEGLAGADAAACDLDHRMLEDASQLYLALNGSLPATQQALVEAQILTEPSARFEITADGAIVPAPGSPCV